ncbi:metallophosphoesterase [Methylococcus sp. EFPC2]|uniref:metallophosphoesterase n=1 Tax=Methylococcus sp. EFPC2 TaxID=2812648 RepID=UPI001967C437|nr:metallophosphoesterase [Methylococcus sp. EFPC2]QSA96047.1 metallophosphoesterase family protein [Methylococcus sp. EFPC2]
MKPSFDHYRCPPIEAWAYQRLAERVGRCHLDQRLGIEHDFEARAFGFGRTFFHIENWFSIHTCIRLALIGTGLHGRGRRNARDVQIRRHEFILPHLPEAFDGYTLLQLSDLHLDSAPDMTDALIATVERVDGWDACVITGDYRAKTLGPYQAALEGMSRLMPLLLATGPVYGILGNHDTIRMVPSLEDMGIRMLLNESIALERSGLSIYLAGIDDPHYYRAENLEKASDSLPDEAVSVLLSHSPEMYRHAAYAHFDIMLSGHTHGGQICLPGGIPLMLNANAPRAYCAGGWRYRDLLGYTSVGSGSCIVDVRLNCPPEITLHTLRRG